MHQNQLLSLSQENGRSVGLKLPEINEQPEKAFIEKGNGRTEMPAKPGIYPEGGDNFIHAMPAYIPSLKSAGMKRVSGYPKNSALGLPYISG
jgi:ornithine cyclodeaminase/alanine dehydrogenase